jgi:soluble lytic murein transglycosylase
LLVRLGFALVCMVALLLAAVEAAAAQAITAAEKLYQQRLAYRQALNHLEAGRSDAFHALRASLEDYPLAPYLVYFEAQNRLASVSDAEMADFEARYPELPAAGILHFRWLKNLGARREWGRLVANYRPSADAELNCLYLRALLATGRRDDAMAGVPALWVVGRSQHQACDPLFEAWIAAGHLTEGHVWQRLQLALAGNERTLARYLLRFFDGPLRKWGQALHDVHVNPAQVTRLDVLRQDNVYSRVVIAHGLNRLARQDATAAQNAWQRFADSHAFEPEDRRVLTETVLLALARAGTFPSSVAMALPAPPSAAFTAGMAEAALAAQNWQALVYWIDEMTADQRSDLRWQYWLARGLARTTEGSERARRTYRALANERNYYGFLAAEQVGRSIKLNGARIEGDAAAAAELQRLPAMTRALELYAVGDLINARRELYALLPTLSPAHQYHAVQLTQQAGWLTQGILLANAADLWDSLDLRFPIAYPDLFERISGVTAVSKPFLLAVARQESAFDPRATSSANARGLMQLMHPTANHVARRLGRVEPSVGDLFDPNLNVELGGHHLAKLMERYSDRRPLAAAAYNAGEGRVDRWVRERRDQPMDVWIESIPFTETRNYVKNVLAFTQVYSQMLSLPVPMLDLHEAVVN